MYVIEMFNTDSQKSSKLESDIHLPTHTHNLQLHTTTY